MRVLASRQLHDTLTNDLTYVITIVNTRMLDADAEERTAFRQVDVKTCDALACAHAVIDRLRDDGTAANARHVEPQASGRSRENTVGSTDMDQLAGFIGRQRSELAALGYEGTGDVTGLRLLNLYDAASRDETRSLLVELFANIRRHCRPGNDYSRSVNIDERRISIVQMNTVTHGSVQSEDDRETNRMPSGRGLAVHRDIIRRLDGTMHAFLEDGVWTIRIRLPRRFSPFAATNGENRWDDQIS